MCNKNIIDDIKDKNDNNFKIVTSTVIIIHMILMMLIPAAGTVSTAG